MKVTINIRRYLEQHAPEAAGQLFGSGGLPDLAEFDIDIDQVLRQNDQVAIIWCIDDVKAMRPHLNDEQCLDVLYSAKDCSTGMTHESIEILADDLFGNAEATGDDA